MNCGRKIPANNKCDCYKERKIISKAIRLENLYEKERQSFYCSLIWIKCRDDVKINQFGIDLLEWYKGYDNVYADTYHHIITIKDNWELRLRKSNIIGLTQQNHMKVHALYEKSKKDKENIQNLLNSIIKQFNEFFYTPGD